MEEVQFLKYIGTSMEKVQVFLMFGFKYRSEQIVNEKNIREHLGDFLEMLRQRRRPFSFIYFHTLKNTFDSGPLPRIRHVLMPWNPQEKSLLV